jgi:hypothetical protein
MRLKSFSLQKQRSTTLRFLYAFLSCRIFFLRFDLPGMTGLIPWAGVMLTYRFATSGEKYQKNLCTGALHVPQPVPYVLERRRCALGFCRQHPETLLMNGGSRQRFHSRHQ